MGIESWDYFSRTGPQMLQYDIYVATQVLYIHLMSQIVKYLGEGGYLVALHI